MSRRLLASVAVITLAFGFFTVVQNNENNCVTVYVDYGKLNNNEKSTRCIATAGSTKALDLLVNAGLQLEGTQKYGDAVVCRVDGLPGRDVESCNDMPPAEAYWAVIVKERQMLPLPLGFGSAWGWAQKGVNELYLDPGDSIGLVFADNGKVVFP